MPSISIKNVISHTHKNLNIEIRDKEFLVILGPNGSGKSTLLNVIAGLSEYQGTIKFNGNAIDHLPANKRDAGYMFQNLALFPHLDVASNVAYSLKMKKWPKQKINRRINELLRLVNISHLASRYPANLSGGEKQRAALARALAASQTLLLLDEPMSNLDEQTAKYLRIELRQIQKRLGITTLYVTHDFMEAINLGDRLAIILDGIVEQVDEPERILFFPSNEKVSNFIGSPNILDCESSKFIQKGLTEVNCSGLKLMVLNDGSDIRKITILPRHVYISDRKPRGRGINRFQAIISDIIYRDDRIRINLKMENSTLMAEISRPIYEEMDLSIGQKVYVILRLKKIRVLEKNRIFRMK